MRTILYDNRLALALATEALVSLGHLDLFEQQPSHPCPDPGRHFPVILDGDIPALIYLGNLKLDEWKVAVALWPGDDTLEWMRVSNASKRRGEAYFNGWLNRWEFQGTAFGMETFCDTGAYIQPERQVRVAEIKVPLSGIAADLMSEHRRGRTRQRLRPVH